MECEAGPVGVVVRVVISEREREPFDVVWLCLTEYRVIDGLLVTSVLLNTRHSFIRRRYGIAN